MRAARFGIMRLSIRNSSTVIFYWKAANAARFMQLHDYADHLVL
jgi:hypothetical protein